ncbi:MAG: hypothetical protein ACQEQV_01285 [Fibrobacterota bacterium]
MGTVLLIAGRINSGKNHAFEHLRQRCRQRGIAVEHIFFARPLKELCEYTFSRYARYLNRELQEIITQVDSPDAAARLQHLMIHQTNWYENKTPSTRLILQDVGTRLIRENVDEDFWAKQAAQTVQALSAETMAIATDFRFPNEYEVLQRKIGKSRSLITLQITRELARDSLISSHTSEEALEQFPFDFTIRNTGSVQEFEEKLDDFIQRLDA